MRVCVFVRGCGFVCALLCASTGLRPGGAGRGGFAGKESCASKSSRQIVRDTQNSEFSESLTTITTTILGQDVAHQLQKTIQLISRMQNINLNQRPHCDGHSHCLNAKNEKYKHAYTPHTHTHKNVLSCDHLCCFDAHCVVFVSSTILGLMRARVCEWNCCTSVCCVLCACYVFVLLGAFGDAFGVHLPKREGAELAVRPPQVEARSLCPLPLWTPPLFKLSYPKTNVQHLEGASRHLS